MGDVLLVDDRLAEHFRQGRQDELYKLVANRRIVDVVDERVQQLNGTGADPSVARVEIYAHALERVPLNVPHSQDYKQVDVGESSYFRTNRLFGGLVWKWVFLILFQLFFAGLFGYLQLSIFLFQDGLGDMRDSFPKILQAI